jgi:hypothetical protein
MRWSGAEILCFVVACAMVLAGICRFWDAKSSYLLDAIFRAGTAAGSSLRTNVLNPTLAQRAMLKDVFCPLKQGEEAAGAGKNRTGLPIESNRMDQP